MDAKKDRDQSHYKPCWSRYFGKSWLQFALGLDISCTWEVKTFILLMLQNSREDFPTWDGPFKTPRRKIMGFQLATSLKMGELKARSSGCHHQPGFFNLRPLFSSPNKKILWDVSEGQLESCQVVSQCHPRNLQGLLTTGKRPRSVLVKRQPKIREMFLKYLDLVLLTAGSPKHPPNWSLENHLNQTSMTWGSKMLIFHRVTLLETNESTFLSNHFWVDDFSFYKGGICDGSLEGKSANKSFGYIISFFGWGEAFFGRVLHAVPLHCISWMRKGPWNLLEVSIKLTTLAFLFILLGQTSRIWCFFNLAECFTHTK